MSKEVVDYDKQKENKINKFIYDIKKTLKENYGEKSITENYVETFLETIKKSNNQSIYNDFYNIFIHYEEKLNIKYGLINNILKKKEIGSPNETAFKKIIGKILKIIKGLKKVKTIIKQVFIYRKLPKYKELYEGIKEYNNILLLFGPPGTGKTEIAQATAKRAGVHFYNIPLTSLIQAEVGQSEKNIKYLFDELKRKADGIFEEKIEENNKITKITIVGKKKIFNNNRSRRNDCIF